MYKLGLGKAEERQQIANILGITEKAREFQKNIYFCFTDYTKAFVWIRTNWKILKEMGIPDRLTCLLRNLYAGQEATVRTRYETTDSRSTGSRLRKEYVRLTERWQQAICCHFVCLIYTQSTSWESPGWMIYKAESRQAGETSIMILRYEDDATLRAESEEELKSLLMRVK